ncbi:MAG TPA: N-acetylmuramic acid 6-phosphate etherase [Gemmatimonadota bacterium]|nr:N-acetylmuramic acid 6-phosphate etherase [Gemmatimonadota bacterium]
MTRDRSHLLTEKVNPRTTDIDTLDNRAILERIHAEDHRAFEAVGEVLEEIARAVELVVRAFRSGGRLVYVGAGTSGRLGVLDAAECPPTFGTDPAMIQGAIAGGAEALVRSREGAEDVAADGAAAVIKRLVGADDIVFGIAAGSTTPFVIGALEEALRRGAATVFLTCVPTGDVPIARQVDVVIAPLTGPEVITGSTRMKAGTATKLVLNMVTTTAMIRLGKTYGNLMIDLQATSEKLEDRGRRILRDLLGVSYEAAGELLREAGGGVKTALVMHRCGVGLAEAQRLLDEAGGFLRAVWEAPAR